LSKSGDERAFEVSLKNISGEALPGNFAITQNASGVTVRVSNEAEIEKVLSETRRLGGKLISVQPVRPSLEELFVEPANDDPKVY
jgi:hypothetical protein